MTYYHHLTVRLLLALAMALTTLQVNSQGLLNVDIIRAEEWSLYGENVRRNLLEQQGQQLLISGNHIYMTSENNKLIDIQNEINNYLSNVHDILSIAAQCYGIYYEVTELARNLSFIQSAVEDNPQGVVAGAFMGERSKVYLRLISTSIALANDLIRLFNTRPSIVKMTDKERIAQLDRIRMKIKEVNMELKGIAMLIRYTNFNDVANRIMQQRHRFKRRTNAEIAEQCLRDWKAHYGIGLKDLLNR